MADEKLQDLEFPVGGVDKLQEFQGQPPGTTPDADNVRSLNPDSLRTRGGSRPGLVQFVPEVIPADLALSLVIQHLNVIVDPQSDALLQNFVTPGDDWVEDPLVPGTFVPPGGWGYQGGATSPPPPPAAYAFVQESQSAGISGDSNINPLVVTYGSTVAGSRLSVVAVQTFQSYDSGGAGGVDLGITVAVKDNAGNNYTQAGSYVRLSDNPAQFSFWAFSLWYRVTVGSNDTTVKVTPSVTSLGTEPTDGIVVAAVAVNYSGNDTSAPLRATSSGTGGTAVPTDNVSAGNVATGSGDLLFVVQAANWSDYFTTTQTPTVTRRNTVAFATPGVYDKFPMNGAADNPTNANVAQAGGNDSGNPKILFAATFKKAP